MASLLPVRDINVGPNASYPAGFITLDNMLLFVADDGVHGRELWRSDGTAEGTQLVIDLNPGPTGGLENHDQLIVLGGKIFFGANNGEGGAQLWQSDGTAEGTLLVKDAAPGESTAVRDLIASGDMLYFMVITGSETPQGFSGQDTLWQSDGTTAGTVPVTVVGEFLPGFSFVIETVDQLLVLNGMPLATIRVDTEPGATARLVRVNGGPQILFQRDAYMHEPDLALPFNLTVLNDALFFTANDSYGDIGCELWRLSCCPIGRGARTARRTVWRWR